MYTQIGIYGKEQLETFMHKTLEQPAETYDANGNVSYLVRSADASLWLHPSHGCAMPVSALSRPLTARVVGWQSDEDACPYCALLHVEMSGGGMATDIPMALHVGNAEKAVSQLLVDQTVELDVICFMRSVNVWDDLEYFERNSGYQDSLIGVNWFIPLGPYSAVDAYRSNRPEAMFIGTVNAAQPKHNEATGESFMLVEVECAGQIYSCLADAEQAEEIKAGQIIETTASFVLCN